MILAVARRINVRISPTRYCLRFSFVAIPTVAVSPFLLSPLVPSLLSLLPPLDLVLNPYFDPTFSRFSRCFGQLLPACPGRSRTHAGLGKKKCSLFRSLLNFSSSHAGPASSRLGESELLETANPLFLLHSSLFRVSHFRLLGIFTQSLTFPCRPRAAYHQLVGTSTSAASLTYIGVCLLKRFMLVGIATRKKIILSALRYSSLLTPNSA